MSYLTTFRKGKDRRALVKVLIREPENRTHISFGWTYSQMLHMSVQGIPCDTEKTRCLLLVPMRPAERLYAEGAGDFVGEAAKRASGAKMQRD